MSTSVSADQTATGWRVEVKGGDDVIIETSGKEIAIAVRPDDDDAQPTDTPLAVTLAS